MNAKPRRLRVPLCAMLSSALCITTLSLFTPARAWADAAHYVDPHPLPPSLHHGMCFIEGPHVHAYQPHKTILYVKRARGFTFIGDPVEFEPNGPRHAYYGHHPVFWVDDDPAVAIEHYCYIKGPHYHWQPPPTDAHFKIQGDVAYYVGPRPSWYRARYQHYRPLAAYYVGVHFARPRVVVRPPAGYVEVNFGPGGAVRAGGGVHIGISVPVPSVGIIFGGGGGGGTYYRRGHGYRRGHHRRGRGHGWGHHKHKKRKKWKHKRRKWR